VLELRLRFKNRRARTAFTAVLARLFLNSVLARLFLNSLLIVFDIWDSTVRSDLTLSLRYFMAWRRPSGRRTNRSDPTSFKHS